MGALKVYDGTVWQTVATQNGVGVPIGGVTNALLAKQSAADNDVAWTTAPVVTGITTGSITVSSSVTFADAVNIAAGSTTGTKIGTSATQKIGFWNATPVVQGTGWSVTAGYVADKGFNPESTTVTELARVLGTLVDTLKSYGLLGP